MKTVKEILSDADPVRDEPHLRDGERERLRQAVLTAASVKTVLPSGWFRPPAALFATVAVILVGIVAVGSQIWSRGGASLQAAMRFEARLAEDHPVAGLREAKVGRSERTVYLHQEIIVTNGDVAHSSIVHGDRPSRFSVGLQFTPEGGEKMRQATADHVGRPVAILIDGDVAAAPVLTGPISTAAVISGDYTMAQAEKIRHGIRVR
jgi:hypothetical protein